MNLGRLWAIIRKELIQVRRDRITLALVVGIPVIELLMFGYALNAVTDHIATVVFDESGTASSRSFVSSFDNTGYLTVRRWAATREEAMRASWTNRSRASGSRRAVPVTNFRATTRPREICRAS